MSDFASLIGGSGQQIPIDQVDPNEAFSYFWSDGAVDLDLGNQGDSFDGLDATGPVTVAGGNGNDTVVSSGEQSDLLTGQNGDDTIYASQDNTAPAPGSTVAGGTGSDSAVGTGGNDYIDGGEGEDSVLAGSGDDQVFGSNGNDSIAGEAGNDALYGATGNDTLLGGDGDDYLSGSSGNDFIQGDAGDDTMYGGSSPDVFFFDDNFGSDVIKDFESTDQIWLTSDINGSGITTAADVKAFLGGGTDPVTSQPFTTITIGADVIRIDNVDQTTFEANIANWVKIQP